eukprot:g2896.t1
MEGLHKYYRENILGPIQAVLESAPKYREKIERCKELELDVDAFARKFHDAQETLKKKVGDEKQCEKWKRTCRSRENKLRQARFEMSEEKESFYDDLSALEVKYLGLVKTHLIRTLSLEMCKNQETQELLRGLTIGVPEAGSEVLLMAAYCSKIWRSEASRNSATQNLSTPLRAHSSDSTATPTPSLDDISCSLVAEQWHESNGSLATPFGEPVAVSPVPTDPSSSPRHFTVHDSFEIAMNRARSTDRTCRTLEPTRTYEQDREKKTSTATKKNEKEAPALPKRQRVDIFTPETRGKGARMGMRLSNSEASCVSRLSGDSADSSGGDSATAKKRGGKPQRVSGSDRSGSSSSSSSTTSVMRNRGPPPPPPPMTRASMKKRTPGTPDRRAHRRQSGRGRNNSVNRRSGKRVSERSPRDSVGSDLISFESPPTSVSSRRRSKRVSSHSNDSNADDLAGLFDASLTTAATMTTTTTSNSASDGELTPEDSDFDEEEEKAPPTRAHTPDRVASASHSASSSNVKEIYVNESVRVRLDESRRKGMFVWDHLSKLWFNRKTNFFFDPKSKLYSKRPGGPFYKFDKATRKLVLCAVTTGKPP